MKNLFNMFEKFINKVKRDGLISAVKRAFVKIYYEYLVKLNISIVLRFRKNKNKILTEIEYILNNSKYDRIIIWRSSIGWSIPLFQRPQQLARELADKKTLVFFEVTRLTDKINFIEKKQDNLYLVDFGYNKFSSLFHELLKSVDCPKYLFTASTCWDLSDKVVASYVKDGYRFIYDYLDELSPELAGTDKLPYNVEKIHDYVINNIEDAFVICTADRLMKDITNKRQSSQNIIYASNGVDYNHFTKLENNVEFIPEYKKILDDNKPIIGYYGALASWFDYDLLRYIAENKKDYNIVLIGAKYDTSFDKERIDKYDNIFYLGPINYYELPYYASKFDACILPFKINDITKSTNPIKIFEYMALNKPVISTDLNECRKYSPVYIAKSKKEFVEKIDLALNSMTSEYKKSLKECAKENTWESKAKYITQELSKLELEHPAVPSKNINLAHILYKIYSQSNKYNVDEKVNKAITNKEKLFIITINSEICMYAMEDENYQKIVTNDNVLLVPDSISMSYALKKTFGRSVARYPGIELLSNMLKKLNEVGGSIYLFGATKKVNNDMVKVIKKEYKNIKIAGNKDGYVVEYGEVQKEILSLKPDLVVVALGVPKQEEFINEIYSKSDNGVFIGVGGSLDVLSGNKKRAPVFMRRINLEWLYRIMTDPKRIRRFYNNNIKFVNNVRRGK